MSGSGTDAALRARERGVPLIDYLRSRGYVQDVSDEQGLAEAFAAGPVTAYVGFDPTAASLHVGHLLSIMVLGTIQRFGHRPIALAGGGTTMVGDPTGKTATRRVLTLEEIQQNLQSVIRQFDRYIDFNGGRFGDGTPAALLVNNADWLLELRYIEFLRDIGRHFSVNEMLAAETYKLRLETSGLNFVEFNYRIVQAYDFLHLYRTTGCRVQMGGSDQWGNIVAGVDLIRRVEGAQAFALVTPLITTASGQKMGKSEGNSLWLDPTMTSPYEYYQYWVNVDDADVRKLLLLYTFLPEERIDELTSESGEALREAKRVLAYESTRLTHGEAAAHEAQETASRLFSGARSAEELLADESLPSISIPRADLAEMTVADLFVRSGLCSSRGDARRMAQQGGLTMGEERLSTVDEPVPDEASAFLLRAGKKRYMRVAIA
ncbi:MAG: tyrosine--tRNA ligase [Chloroflexota bacterium]|nr:tyrosine--tRNA ligase [Chloroflexota bacterium]